MAGRVVVVALGIADRGYLGGSAMRGGVLVDEDGDVSLRSMETGCGTKRTVDVLELGWQRLGNVAEPSSRDIMVRPFLYVGTVKMEPTGLITLD